MVKALINIIGQGTGVRNVTNYCIEYLLVMTASTRWPFSVHLVLCIRGF